MVKKKGTPGFSQLHYQGTTKEATTGLDQSFEFAANAIADGDEIAD